MKTGEAVTDGQGRTWAVGEMLGRGLWGTSWAVRDASGRDMVLKVPLLAADLPADAPVPDGLLAACKAALLEQADLLRRASLPFLPRLEDQITVAGGPALLLPRYPTSLKRRLGGGMPLSEAIALVRRITATLQEAGGRVHGNLRPSNVLLNDRGEVVLSDVLTPALHPWRARLQELATGRDDYNPPEGGESPRAVWDTWALGLVLYRAAMQQPPTPAQRDARREERVTLPRQGLDKLELVALRDRAIARLKDDRANARFAPRVGDRLASLLNRALSHDSEPSPPYRFHDLGAMRPRIDEVAELVDPRVEDVGHLLLSSTAKNGAFQGGESATFSVTIGCSPGVSGHEDVATGLQLLDLDAEGDDARVPVPDTRYSVKQHPSGRLRFDFELPDLPPGRYRVNVAFTIKDGHDEPQVATGDFEVRPPPGYVPPAEEPPSGAVPIPLPRRQVAEPTAPNQPQNREAPAGELFPLPIAPSAPAEAKSAPESVEVEVELEPTLGPEADDPPTPAAVTATAPLADRPTAPPPLSVRPSARPTTAPTIAPPEPPSADERPTHPSAEPPPGWARPVDWDDVGGEQPYLPGPQGGEDLPSWNDRPTGQTARTGVAERLERVLDLVRRDTYTAFMVGISTLLVFLIGVFLLLESC